MAERPVDSARNTMIVPLKDSTYGVSTAPIYDSEKRSTVNRAPSSTSSSTLDSRSADIKSWAAAIDRMSDSRLDRQRFIVSGRKDDEISLNALGAKLERALGRRMSGQDAIFTRRPRPSTLSAEKRSIEVTAA